MMSVRSVGLFVLAALLPLSALAQEGGQRPPPAVTVKTLQPQSVGLTATLPGRVVASASAEVRPQVAGSIL